MFDFQHYPCVCKNSMVLLQLSWKHSGLRLQLELTVKRHELVIFFLKLLKCTQKTLSLLPYRHLNCCKGQVQQRLGQSLVSVGMSSQSTTDDSLVNCNVLISILSGEGFSQKAWPSTAHMSHGTTADTNSVSVRVQSEDRGQTIF